MDRNNNSKNTSYYFPIFIGLGIIIGVIINQIPIGLCLGTVVGLTLDNKKKKIN